jgi:hypothetical protein
VDGLGNAADVPLALAVGLLEMDADFVLLAAHAGTHTQSVGKTQKWGSGGDQYRTQKRTLRWEGSGGSTQAPKHL